MSVISEVNVNMPIKILSQFVACKYGESFKWELSKEFNVGDEVLFLDSYEDDTVKQGHLKWKIKFKDEKGNTYSASQLYFATLEEWKGISDYFNK